MKPDLVLQQQIEHSDSEVDNSLVVFRLNFSLLCGFLFSLQEVPEELWELLELEKLNLSLNGLKVLPSQLAHLSNLVVLNLWGNQVNRLLLPLPVSPLHIGSHSSLFGFLLF